nr:hypothetical protein [uncultured Anaerotignum sp.]
MSKNRKKQNKGEQPSRESHAYTCKRSRGSSPVTPIFYVQKRKRNKTREKGPARGHEVERRHSHFLCLKTVTEQKQALIHNIMGRYGCISSFFVQKSREKAGDAHPFQRKTEIIYPFCRFSGKFDWKINDFFLKTKKSVGLSTYIYGEKILTDMKTVWVQFETVPLGQWNSHGKYDMLFYKGSFETGV